jgi:sugar phosphate permease
MRKATPTSWYYGWFLWSIAALFYSYEFIQRITPSIITGQLRATFSINEEQLALIGAMYFYAYAPFQLVSGVLIDKYGVRPVLVTASVILTLASFLFASTDNIYLVYTSRFLIGLGSAFAFVGCLKIGSQWLATRSFPIVVGLTNLCGTIGALSAGAPLGYLVSRIGWREALIQVSIAGLVISLLLWLFLRDKPSSAKGTIQAPPKLLSGLALVVKNPQSWLIAFYGALLVMPIAALPEMWGVEFLKISYDYDPQKAATVTHTIFIGTALGGPLIGWLMKYVRDETDFMMLCTLGALVLLSIFLYWAQLPRFSLHMVLFFYGILTANMLLCFDFICRIHPTWAQGAAIGFVNMVIMTSAGLGQHGVGWILNLLRMQHEGLNLVEDYHIALSILPICLVISIALTLFMRHDQRDNL